MEFNVTKKPLNNKTERVRNKSKSESSSRKKVKEKRIWQKWLQPFLKIKKLKYDRIYYEK